MDQLNNQSNPLSSLSDDGSTQISSGDEPDTLPKVRVTDQSSHSEADASPGVALDPSDTAPRQSVAYPDGSRLGNGHTPAGVPNFSGVLPAVGADTGESSVVETDGSEYESPATRPAAHEHVNPAIGEAIGPLLPPLAESQESDSSFSARLGQSASKWVTGAADDVRWLASRSAAGLSDVGQRMKNFDLRELGDRVITPDAREKMANSASGWKRGVASILSRKRTGWLVTITVIVVLLVTILPPLIGVARALQDYSRLKTLGESGLKHLLAAKDDIGTFDNLQQYQALLDNSDTTTNAPYRYEVQRQSGTSYPVRINVQSTQGLNAKGIPSASFSATVGKNTIFPVGGPKATPTPSPAPTPAPTGTPGPNGTPAVAQKAFSADTLKTAVSDVRAAQSDFAQLRDLLNNPDWVLDLAGDVPGTNTRLVTVRALADVGYNGSTIILDFADAVSPIMKRSSSGVLSTTQPIILPADVTALHNAIKDALTRIDTIQSRLGDVDLTALPITAKQADTFNSLTKQLPQLRDLLSQAGDYIDMGAWFLGVDAPRKFLVQTLDRAELRPSGGFTGDYGVLSLTGGRLDPFNLFNINDIDYNGTGWIFGRKAPAAYSWWPFSDWGLRDSNLSPDFPTTAKINIDVFKNEGGGDVDGVIHLSPVVAEHVLTLTGPIYVPDYNETVTATNLEDRIHYYQQDPAGIALEEKLNPGDLHPDGWSFSVRKRFTQLVVRLVQDKVKHLPASQFASLAKIIFDDMRSKDIQMYVTNQKVEDQLTKYRIGGAVDERPGIDGYTLNQANVSVAKSTPYVQMTQTDNVSLDDKGGATHRLTITMFNNETGPVYGFSTYRDYLRIYVPQQASLKSGTGFTSGNPMCWMQATWDPNTPKPDKFAALPDCPPNPYPDGELVCPAGNYGPGRAPGFISVETGTPDTLGPPTSTTSDLPGRAMFGGWVVIPNGCTATLTLRWYVPNIVRQ